VRGLGVALLLWASAAFAADRRVTEGVKRFENAEFARARDVLAEGVDDPALSAEDSILARTYLAASYHALGDISSARGQLLLLFRDHPGARIDPSIFLPDLISLAEAARIEVAKRWPSRDKEPLPAAAPPQVTTSRSTGLTVSKWVSAVLAVLTLGAGIATGLWSQADQTELHAGPHPTATVDALIASGRSKALAANVLYGVGGGVAALSVALFVVQGTF
jgi:hypothetical protein